MSLAEIVDNTRTDKNTTHTYLDLYQSLLISRKESAKHVLEIGIGDGGQGISNGGSIKLWHDFFLNATVHALDICSNDCIWDGIKNNERIKIYNQTDAYNIESFKTNFLDKNIKCDMVLDDGPHSLESMKLFIQLYSQILSDDGILILEDVQDMNWIEILKESVPENLKQYIEVYDLRHMKNRYDDIVFVINKKIKS
jgi:methylase of polypeptide subunit release factors